MTGAVVAAAALDLAQQYRAARAGAAHAPRHELGRLLFTGKDAADLLHRLSTNAVAGLAPGLGTATVFTTNTGRILDLVTLPRIEAGLLAHGAVARMAALRDWVERYTFREQVNAADWTASHETFSILGPRAAEVAGRLWGGQAADLPLHHVMTVEAGGVTAFLVRTFPLAQETYLVTAAIGAREPLVEAIRQGAGVPLAEIGPECVEIMRIDAALPAHPGELNEDHNPWEARLDHAISLSKGCYVGQEVIARLNTYRKVARLLIRIATQGWTPEPGAAVRTGGETIGTVTSAALIPDGSGKSVALAYVRDEDAVAGRAVSIARPDGEGPAVVEEAAR